MSTVLGKRKSRSIEDKPEKKRVNKPKSKAAPEPEEHFNNDAHEIFRRHFEAQFKPLPEIQKSIAVVEDADEGDESDAESEWGGISEEEEGVQVVEHTDAQAIMAAMSKEQLKSFMSSKPPTSSTVVTILRDKDGTEIADDDQSEAANLRKDLELQRLIAEAHLYESSTDHVHSGKNRHKATDMRLQSLGAKTSAFKQEKMPMAMRKGIVAKASEREETRRREAKENGIILEKATQMKGKVAKKTMRDRGVGAPGVGKFSGGMLSLSKRDIYEIEGPKSSGGRGGKRGGRGGGRGRGKGKGKS